MGFPPLDEKGERFWLELLRTQLDCLLWEKSRSKKVSSSLEGTYEQTFHRYQAVEKKLESWESSHVFKFQTLLLPE